ncbi:GTPase Era [Defluviitalea raffinosedens]|uniref:GTPase Era n=1 Tax=Defluviitalea raffinosedens TaxID=1450156 RepID=A0A7C8LM94_9FIRM|nr:GTPase Era [Defluviitalea raffinosedens]KAE9636983.1 GTPase Era [Defluviitalea raffinosedens]MBM7685264.1 GTP-binding protein Era [Defluviitalea raffinosedens]HHW67297.1 GTPase Era [Candidatus Epulonipiscium sp.]
MKSEFRSGFVTIIGRPNVGKSTLMNHLVGEKIAIMSDKPQTTRNRIQSILTRDDFQVVFIDTPGIHKPKHKLGHYMVKVAETTLNEVDIVLMLVEPTPHIGQGDRYVISELQKVKTPVILVINKIDTVEKQALLEVIEAYKNVYNFAEIIPISAFTGENCDRLLDVIRERLPKGPQYFPADMITDQPEKQLVAELIREKALHLLQQEIPHGIAVEIESMKKREDQDIVDINAVIYCERDSHKAIVIGKQGSMLKQIGSRSRIDIERLLGSKVFLELWVKVKKNWRDDDFLLKNFGFDPKSI